MLDNDHNCCDFIKFYYNVKIQYKPQSRSCKIPVVFLATTLCSILILNGLIVFNRDYLYIIEGCVFGFMLLLYLLLLLPPRKPEPENLTAYQTEKMCYQCCTKVTKRSYHCDICGICVARYDHHCTWINNCVGTRNIGRFITFIFMLIISLFVLGSTALWGILKAAEIDLS